jgi:SPP1 gp7 family putative phage head morphogenesis protein
MISFQIPLPFDEAIRSFRDRTALTPDRYKQLTAEARAKAFTVSGVTRMDVLTDIHGAIDRAMTEGTTFAEFKKEMREVMSRRGWEGLSPYRLDTIFRTNVQAAYQAGHYQRQMEVAGSHPYWQYVAVMDARTRPAHAAMNGRTLRYDDPFWSTSYPPNGFNCRCAVRALTKGEISRERLPIEEDAPGIADPGFGTNPGEVSYRDVLATKSIDLSSREKWVPLIDRGIAEAGRPSAIPYDPMPARLGPTLKELDNDRVRLRSLFHKAIGGKSVVINTPDRDSIILSGYLFDHLSLDGREAYFPLIRHVLEDPFEIWLTPMKGEQTGRVVMLKRFIRFFQDKRKHRLMLVGEYQGGTCVGFTFFRGDKEGYFLNQRMGWLLYER